MNKGIHFGCGGRRIDGWDNFDLDLDITKVPFPFTDASYDAAFASHVMEHVSGPQALAFMTEVHRLLKPGGWFRLSIPVIGPWLPRDKARDLTFNHGHLTTWNEDMVRTFFWMAGFDQQKTRRVDRDTRYDHHHLEIGEELDYMESCRMIAYK